MLHDKREVYMGFRTTKKIAEAVEEKRKQKDYRKYTKSDIIHLALEKYLIKEKPDIKE